MSKAILIKADDWEGLFLDGVLVEEGHTLNEGSSRIKYFIQLSKQYNFDLGNMKEVWVTEEDEERLNYNGSFPQTLLELDGDYENTEN